MSELPAQFRPSKADSSYWRVLIFFAVPVAGVVSVFRPTLFSHFSRMQVDLGDTRLNNFILEHSYRWIVGWITFKPISLWNHPVFFPVTNTAAYTEVLFGAAPIYWPFRALGFEPDTSFQLWMITVLVLDFAAMSLFLKRGVGLGTWSSAVGAFLFSFGSPRIAQLNHQQMLPQFFTILALFGLVRAFSPARISARQGIWLCFVSMAAQLWASAYLGWFLCFALLVALVWTLGLPAQRESFAAVARANRSTIMAAGGTSLVLAAPLVVHYVSAWRATGARPWWDAARMIPPLQAWTYLGPQSWLYSWQPQLRLFGAITTEYEQRIGVGWITLGLAIAGLYHFQKAYRRWGLLLCLVGITLLVLVTSYPGGLTPWKLVFYAVPGGNGIRSVSRIAMIFLIPLSIGLAFLLDKKVRLPAALAAVLICFAEQGQSTGSYDKLQARTDVAVLAARLDKNCVAFYYSPAFRDFGDAAPEYKLQIDAMWAALQSGVPTLNGYSGKAPKGWRLGENRLFDDTSRARTHEALATWSAFWHIDQTRLCWIDS